MEDWEKRFDRVVTPGSPVPSHRDGLRQILQSSKIPVRHGYRIAATLGVTALVLLGAISLGYPSLARNLWNSGFVQTITLRTKSGQTIMIRKMECNAGECLPLGNEAAGDSSWTTPDGRKVVRKTIRKNVPGPMRIAMACMDTSELTELFKSGLELPQPSGEILRIANPDGKNNIWVVDGDTVTVEDMTMIVDRGPIINEELPGETSGQATSPSEHVSGISTDFELRQNYPNPFNPTTQISFDLKRAGQATLKVYNLMGEEVATLLNGYTEAGQHTMTFDGANLPSGTYLYTLRIADSQVSKTMVLAK
jgi:hypothetical protein